MVISKLINFLVAYTRMENKVWYTLCAVIEYISCIYNITQEKSDINIQCISLYKYKMYST